MSVNTKSVVGRRTLSFHRLTDIVADAEMLVSSTTTRTIGNWPLSQLLSHLASTIDNSIDGFPSKAPLFIRIIGPFLKKGMLTNPRSGK